MIIVNTDFIEGKKLGMINNVRGTTASANRLNEESSIATKRMVDKAKAMGADAVINVRYASIISMNSTTELIAFGTAVKFI